ncbi:MAG: sulfate ABC transporter substrate-binding protein [Lachnospiraceae bacterium]|nr:sulfate ABC transporter substrate-binding protein [Lachnospiraceae bacterium]
MLFTEKKKSAVWRSDDQRLLAEAVRILSGADLLLYNEINTLKEENKKLRADNRKLFKELNDVKQYSFFYRLHRKLNFLKNRSSIFAFFLCTALLSALLGGCAGRSGSSETKASASSITNVSYDPTRELYENYNELFKEHYKEETGIDVQIVQSHGGSGAQARSVVEGADADVVTLALAHDITLIENTGLIEPDWLEEFDRDSSPYTSTIVFLVRAGNEKAISDWDDLVKEDVEIIHPDPKSSGGACWNFLAAWHYADQAFRGDETQIRDFLKLLYANVTVMDSGARGSTTTFVENGQGDVLIAWENEALQTLSEYPGKYELISPSVSILAQPSVAIVDDNADKNGSQELAKEYLSYLYSQEAQTLIAEMGYRPSDETVLSSHADKFDVSMDLCTIDDFGGWNEAFDTYFTDGGVFDEIIDSL